MIFSPGVPVARLFQSPQFPEFPWRLGIVLGPEPCSFCPGMFFGSDVFRVGGPFITFLIGPGPPFCHHFEVDVPAVEVDDGDGPLLMVYFQDVESYLFMEHLVGQGHKGSAGKRLAGLGKPWPVSLNLCDDRCFNAVQPDEYFRSMIVDGQVTSIGSAYDDAVNGPDR